MQIQSVYIYISHLHTHKTILFMTTKLHSITYVYLKMYIRTIWKFLFEDFTYPFISAFVALMLANLIFIQFRLFSRRREIGRHLRQQQILKIYTKVGDDGSSPASSPLANFTLLNKNLVNVGTACNYSSNSRCCYIRAIDHMATFQKQTLFDKIA